MTSSTILALCASVLSAQINVGDEVVTVCAAPVMSGPEKVSELQPGVQLSAKDVKGPWVLVRVSHVDREFQGWVLDSNLVSNPRTAFGKLAIGWRHQSIFDKGVKSWDTKFKSIDVNHDDAVTLTEFLAGIGKPTLDDLNRRFQTESARSGRPKPDTPEHAVMYLKLNTLFLDFGGWRADCVDEMEKCGGSPQDITEDFLRTGDIRRSPLARRLVDREDPDLRTRRGQALFTWADTDRDKKLTLDEFKQALITGSPPDSDRQGRRRSGKDANGRTRRDEQRVADGTGAASDTEKLIQQVGDDDLLVRIRALEALAKMGPRAKAAVPALIEALQDEQMVRIRAIAALKNVGPEAKAAVPAIARLLQDKDATIRMQALETLQGMGAQAKAAVPALARLLQDEDATMRLQAVDALQAIGPDARPAIPALQQLLDDKDEVVRRSALEALEKLRCNQ
jgi:HEAT repeat protein